MLRKYKDGSIGGGHVTLEVLRWKIEWNLLKSSSHLTNPSQPLLLAGKVAVFTCPPRMDLKLDNDVTMAISRAMTRERARVTHPLDHPLSSLVFSVLPSCVGDDITHH